MPSLTCPALLTDTIEEKYTSNPDGTVFQDDTPDGWRAVTHREFRRDVQALAHSLIQHGVSPGDRVGILARPCYAWEVVDKATMLAGGINVGLDYKSSPDDLAFVIDHSGICGIVVENLELLELIPEHIRSQLDFIYLIDDKEGRAGPETRQLAEELRRHADAEWLAPRARPDDIATLIYTSGTTSHPKGIPLTHRQLVMNLPIMSDVFRDEISQGHRTLSWVPLYNGTGRMMSSVNYHLDVVQYFVRDPTTLFEKIHAVAPSYLVLMPRITEKVYQKVQEGLAARKAPVRALVYTLLLTFRSIHLPAVRSALDRLLLGKLRRSVWGPRLRFLLSGSAPIDPNILRFFAGMGVETYEVYGLSELSVLVSMNRPGHVRYGSVGEPLPTMDIKLGEDKEILVRSPSALSHYWKDEAGELIGRDGYLRTGDLGDFRDGYLYIIGRKKEIIKTSTGQRISPVAVENVYRDIPGIESLMVVGNGRKFLTALVAPTPGFAAKLVREDTDVYAWLETEFTKRHPKLGKNRRVQRFAIVPTPFSVENGEMTSTLKLRRNVIEQHYREAIDELYRDA